MINQENKKSKFIQNIFFLSVKIYFNLLNCKKKIIISFKILKNFLN